MFYLLVIVSIAVISYLLTRNIINPVFIFSIVWSVIMTLYQLNIGNFNSISSQTYFIITSGVIAFSVGVLIFQHLIKNKRFVFRSNNKGHYGDSLVLKLKYQLILFLCITSILVLIPEAINSIKILAGGGTFETIRSSYSAGNNVINNSIFSLYRNYIVKPFGYIIYPLCAVDFIRGERKKWLFGFTIVIAILNTLYEGGRIQFVYLAIHFLIVIKLSELKIIIPKTVKRIMIGIVVLMVVIVGYVTVSRGSESNFSQSILLYVSGCVPLLDYHLQALNFQPDYTYGLVTLSGFLKPFFSLLENIGIPYPMFLTNIQHVFEVEQTVAIGENLRMNAYVSVFYYFFYDGGFVGNILGMFMYGGASWMFYRRAQSLRGMVYYALIIQGLIFSMIRFQFTISHYCIAFILTWFLFKRYYKEEKV